MTHPQLYNLLLASILGASIAASLSGALAIFFVPGFFERFVKRVSRPLGLALVVGWALIAMAAVTQIDLTTQVKNILPSANGGTASAYFAITGPTAARTYTLPDANATILTSNTPVTAAQGGTGLATLTAHCVLIGEGTGSLALVCPSSTSGYALLSNGISTDPSFQAVSIPNLYQEVPSGSINGTNTTFTLAHTPASSTNVNLFENGVQQRQGSGLDYTISGATITYLAAPPSGTTLNALYF